MTTQNLSIQSIVETMLAGFPGVELVEIARLPKGLLSITIDEPNSNSGVAIKHCEQITRQLQAVFFVENIDYARLEVGSPGVDRLLSKPADFARFAGERATVKLREAYQNRKTYTGILQALPPVVDGVQHYDLAIEGEALSKTQQKKIAKTIAQAMDSGQDGAYIQPDIALNFTLDEIEWARLDPLLDFKGKS